MLNFFKKLFKNLSSEIKELPEEGAIIIDVRTSFEFKSGHFPGSKNIPLDLLPGKIDELKKLNKTIITVCRSGARSSSAKDMLLKAGINAYDAGAWTNLKHQV